VERIGQTDYGDHIVKMTDDEKVALEALARAIEGKPVWEMQSRRNTSPLPDLTTVLGVIEEYATILGKVGELKHDLDDWYEYLRTRKGND
jgi:hypothetical protein